VAGIAGIEGRVALVTGAAGGGIGETTARQLASAGAKVVVTDRHEARTREVAARLAADFPATTVVGVTLELGDRAAAEAAVAATTEVLGPIQILVNSAAVNVVGDIFTCEWDDFVAVLEANVVGAWHLGKLAAPGMQDAGGGVIVNITSCAPELAGAAGEAPYAASKAALIAISKGFARAGGPFNIRSNCVSMGVVRGTRFVEVHHPELIDESVATTPLGRLSSALDIADAVVFLASDAASTITGATIDVNGGYYMRP
jgi:NAD(P)-dependent dehydrogenase (short-subunit alcohol dehydrogenase family)